MTDGQRTGPDGTVLRWRVTLNALAGGLMPFLITGATPSTPLDQHHTGSSSQSVQIEHPDPPSLAARLSGPNGSKVLG